MRRTLAVAVVLLAAACGTSKSAHPVIPGTTLPPGVVTGDASKGQVALPLAATQARFKESVAQEFTSGSMTYVASTDPKPDWLADVPGTVGVVYDTPTGDPMYWVSLDQGRIFIHPEETDGCAKRLASFAKRIQDPTDKFQTMPPPVDLPDGTPWVLECRSALFK